MRLNLSNLYRFLSNSKLEDSVGHRIVCCNHFHRSIISSKTNCNVGMTNCNADKSKPFKVLFCGVEFPSAFEYTKQLLESDVGIQVEFIPLEKVLENVSSFDFIVPRMCKLDAAIISRAKNAKVICQYGVGLEGVDIPLATKAGITVARIGGNSNRFNSISCAEHCIYLMLGMLRKQYEMSESVANQRLGEPVGGTLWGKTILIVGFGAIGEELVLRLKAFNTTVLGIRRSWSRNIEKSGLLASQSAASVLDEKGGSESLLPFVSRADIVVMSAVLTDETRGMVNDEFYAAMKPQALLVNIARGGLLNYEATKRALECGKLGGLGIDVAWHEPFNPEDPVARHPATILTPHIGGVTEVSYIQMAEIMSKTIREARDGVSLTSVEIVNATG